MVFIMIVYILSIIVAIAGLGVAIWSFFDTRKQYYIDYINKKKIDLQSNVS